MNNVVHETREENMTTNLFDNQVIDAPKQELAATLHDTMTPIELLSRAVERGGFDAEQLKILAELQERYQANRAREEFAEAMNACQQELPLIVKDANNSHTKSAYVRMETVQHIAKPVISKHGFSLSFGEADCLTPNMKRTICDVRHIAGHCEQYHLDLPIDGVGSQGGKSGMNAVQGAVSTGTYAQRYLTCRIFNITIANSDLDGREPAHPNPEPNPSAPTAAPRGKRPATNSDPVSEPIHPNPNGIQYADVKEISDKWKSDNPKLGKTDFGDWVQKLAERNFRGEWNGWTASDLGKCQEALGLENTSGIPFVLLWLLISFCLSGMVA